MHNASKISVGLIFLLFFYLPLQAQDLNSESKKIFLSPWSEKQKVDSLFVLLAKDYYKDYALSGKIGDTIVRLSNKVSYTRGVGKGNIILALVAEGKGDLKAMALHIDQAAAIFSQNKPSLELGLLNYCQGIYFRRKKRDKEAIEIYLKSLRVAEAIGNKHMMGSCYTSLGIMSVGRGEYDKALTYYQKTMRYAVETKDYRRIQHTHTNIGIVYLRKKQYDAAIRSHLKALKLAKALNIERDIAFVYNDLGAVYLASDNSFEQAIDYLKKSIAIRERIDEKSEIAYTYNYLGQAYLKQGDKDATITWIKKAFQVAKAIENNKQQYEALEELSLAYRHFAQNDSAYYYLKTHNKFRDSVRKIQQTDAIAELTIQYETEKKAQEIALLTKNNTIQRLDLNQRNLYLLLAGLLVACTGLMAWLIYRAKKLKEEKLKKEASMQVALLQLEGLNTLQKDRLRISRDLHDNIGANLTFISTSLNELNSEKTQLHDIKTLINDTIAELKRTVWLINKPSVKFEEWLIKLREYYSKIEKVKIGTTDNANDDWTLSAKFATALFRISQEAVNNSLKYANAKTIEIRIKIDNAILEMTIIDNGLGFDIQHIKHGFGLNNMQQNAQEIDGTISIESIVGKGTTIAAKIPLKNTQ